MKLRTFIAIALPAEVISALATVQKQLQQCIGTGVKWINPQSIHITVKFLGDIASEEADSVGTVMQRLLTGYAPFEFTIANIGVFPDMKKPRVIWAGIQEAQGILARLHRQFDQAMTDFGIAAEGRSFQPHVTLGRIKRIKTPELEAAIAGHQECFFGKMTADSLILFRSELRPTGAVYTPLHMVKLAWPPS